MDNKKVTDDAKVFRAFVLRAIRELGTDADISEGEIRHRRYVCLGVLNMTKRDLDALIVELESETT